MLGLSWWKRQRGADRYMTPDEARDAYRDGGKTPDWWPTPDAARRFLEGRERVILPAGSVSLTPIGGSPFSAILPQVDCTVTLEGYRPIRCRIAVSARRPQILVNLSGVFEAAQFYRILWDSDEVPPPPPSAGYLTSLGAALHFADLRITGRLS